MKKELKKSQSAGGVVINNKGDILLVKHNERTWSFPKGHIKENENIQKAAIREIYEETGITKLKLIKKFNSYQRESFDIPPEWKTIFLFLFNTNQEEINPIASDVMEASWVKKDEVAKLLTHEEDKKFFLDIKDQI